MTDTDAERFDYVVVGSGAGGGPLAANLALAGFRVLLLEAGGETHSLSYAVPGYVGPAIEDEVHRWDYFVRHWTNQEQQKRDPKYVPSREGILYPRAGTLGGCTAHNALIATYPADSDWNRIADITGDDSWRAENMRRYFQKIERCGYLTPQVAEGTGHGLDGWLSTEKADLLHDSPDEQLQDTLNGCIEAGGLTQITPEDDPNGTVVATGQREGYFTIPLTTKNHVRVGPREFVQSVRAQFPDRLQVRTHALARRVLFHGDERPRAVGVEYLSGAHIYRADPRADEQCSLTEPEVERVFVDREVIIACGTFNTPQLLKLSGVGPREELESFGIGVVVDLPGVGANLQDRYEVSLVNRMASNWQYASGATFSDDSRVDPVLQQWVENAEGPLTSNGLPLMYLVRSQPEKRDPDIILFARPSRFQGYFPLWFSTYKDQHDVWAWTVLKAHTNNRGGTVKLCSSDPKDTPNIEFHYFEEGTDEAGEDIAAIVAGFKMARELMEGSPHVIEEILPGAEVVSDEDIAQYIRDQSWGHHASCSCPIGSDDDPMAVLDSEFRVRGVDGLRVVDASIFPHIPGTFIVVPIFIASEKAAEVIAAATCVD